MHFLLQVNIHGSFRRFGVAVCGVVRLAKPFEAQRHNARAMIHGIFDLRIPCTLTYIGHENAFCQPSFLNKFGSSPGLTTTFLLPKLEGSQCERSLLFRVNHSPRPLAAGTLHVCATPGSSISTQAVLLPKRTSACAHVR